MVRWSHCSLLPVSLPRTIRSSCLRNPRCCLSRLMACPLVGRSKTSRCSDLSWRSETGRRSNLSSRSEAVPRSVMNQHSNLSSRSAMGRRSDSSRRSATVRRSEAVPHSPEDRHSAVHSSSEADPRSAVGSLAAEAGPARPAQMVEEEETADWTGRRHCRCHCRRSAQRHCRCHCLRRRPRPASASMRWRRRRAATPRALERAHSPGHCTPNEPLRSVRPCRSRDSIRIVG